MNKLVNIILFGLGIGLISCKSSPRIQNKVDSIASIESGPGKIIDERFLIVPGRSVGEISLGDDMVAVIKKLGKPDAGDAAMGKAWGIWYNIGSEGKEKNELAIYSAYRDTSMRVKEVKQIRITSNAFKTQDGFTTQRTMNDTELRFPGMEQVATYLNENQDTVFVYDAQSDGIGFEFLKGRGISVTVHPKNVAVNNSYITLHPEWKQVF
ncbi:hypothetical protein [Pedobacter rhizosphaerae]|uniref:Lipoprotein n=1 Tax=Pedobacter rhizosphaerae TaxID=390241 RepID=A0A1H9ST90_9SPHI|nr:hypothetical protein [Pedobacter rhizosphaerae]SER87549.1 hypothetical protein SAMN04488023_11943 [Pedobacter rhizosphaerae]